MNKKILHIITLAAIILFVGSCRNNTDVEDIMSSVSFTIMIPDTIDVQKMNAVVKCTNINTGEEIIKTSIKKPKFKQNLLKGVYLIHTNGTILYKTKNKTTIQTRKIRGYNNEMILLKNREKRELEIMFLSI